MKQNSIGYNTNFFLNHLRNMMIIIYKNELIQEFNTVKWIKIKQYNCFYKTVICRNI